MPVRQLAFRGNNRINDAMLPSHRDTAEVRLVADFVVKVVEPVQFANDLLRQRLVDRERRSIDIGLVNRVYLLLRV